MKNPKLLFFALRPKQWIKNFFLFLPMIFGGKLFAYPENVRTVAGFLIFSAAAGAVYLMNDLIDLDRDKFHPVKKLRPLASGKISKKDVRTLCLALLIISVMCSYLLDRTFSALIIGYLIFNYIYSVRLKHWVIIDVFCIALFFLIRIFSGSVISSVDLSPWIIFMTMLLALFLGFNKRRQELVRLGKSAGQHRNVLLKYNRYFIDQMIGVITSSIVVAYMLYAFEIIKKAPGRNFFIATVPLVYYGIFRYLYLIHRLHKDGDPTRMILDDDPMKWNLILWLGISVWVLYF